jgi:hypothetical protein
VRVSANLNVKLRPLRFPAIFAQDSAGERVKESALFEKAVHVGVFGIAGYQFGKYLSEEQFKEITTAAGGVQKAGSKHR